MANAITHRGHINIQPRRNADRTLRVPYHELQSDLEFSDHGRDSRFPPGWWIVPMPFLSVFLWWGIIRLALSVVA